MEKRVKIILSGETHKIEEKIMCFLETICKKLNKSKFFDRGSGFQLIIVNHTPKGEFTLKKIPTAKKKMKKVMHEFKEHALHSGSKTGPEVKYPKQAIAIGLSEARKAGAKVAKKRG